MPRFFSGNKTIVKHIYISTWTFEQLTSDVNFNFSLLCRNLDQWMNKLRSGNSWKLNTIFFRQSCRMISWNLNHKIRDNSGLERSEAWIFCSRPWWDWHGTYFLVFTKMWCLFSDKLEDIFSINQMTGLADSLSYLRPGCFLNANVGLTGDRSLPCKMLQKDL